MATASESSLSEDDKVFGPRANNNNEAYNGKLGGVVNKPNIWWFIELIKSENTHFTLQYQRLKDNYDKKGFKETFQNYFRGNCNCTL
jgi:hypothetical protein